MTASDLASLSPPIPFNESERLRAVIETCLLDTPADARFDDVTALAALCLDAPISAVSLIDQHRQWFKSIRGVVATETSRHDAFCSYTILSREPLIVMDASRDVRFQHNPMVVGSPGVRFYAGVPIRSPDGLPIGALCVADTVPRERVSPVAISILEELAQTIERYVAMHRLEAFLDKGTGFQNRRRFEENVDCLAVTEGAASDLWWAMSVETCSPSEARAWGPTRLDAHVADTGLRLAEMVAARGGTHRLSERHLGFLVRCSSTRAALALAAAVERALEASPGPGMTADTDERDTDERGRGAAMYGMGFADDMSEMPRHRVTLRRIDLFDDPARLVRALLTPEVTALRFDGDALRARVLAHADQADRDATTNAAANAATHAETRTGERIGDQVGDQVGDQAGLDGVAAMAEAPEAPQAADVAAAWRAVPGKENARLVSVGAPVDDVQADASAYAELRCLPRYALESRRCVGFDATIRGNWPGCQDAIEAVLTRFGDWRARRGTGGISDVRVHLDLVPGILLLDDFQAWLEWRLIEHRILPMQVAIELPAAALFDPLSALRPRVNRLMAGGIGMTVVGDEAGTGGSFDLRDWLPYLSFGAIRFAPAALDAIAEHPMQMELARRLASLAHAVGSRVLVSGLDTDTRVDVAHLLECDEGTGAMLVEASLRGGAALPTPLSAGRA